MLCLFHCLGTYMVLISLLEPCPLHSRPIMFLHSLMLSSNSYLQRVLILIAGHKIANILVRKGYGTVVHMAITCLPALWVESMLPFIVHCNMSHYISLQAYFICPVIEKKCSRVIYQTCFDWNCLLISQTPLFAWLWACPSLKTI